MKVVFRADASVLIGTGHVMRCLTLAEELRRRGHICSFVCRDHPGHLGQLILGRGFGLELLRSPGGEDGCNEISEGVPHASLLDVHWRVDASQTQAALESLEPDWVVVDHYALDARWERHIDSVVGRIMVIDDLADRDHHASVLLDQNVLNKEIEARYLARTNSGCNLLLGPGYALLSQEYCLLANALPERDGSVSRVLVFVGGSDPYHLTESYIKVLNSKDFSHLQVDVVIGRNHPSPETVEKLIIKRPHTRLYSGLPSLSVLMIRADLMLGAGGATNWERMCLGLNAIVISVAANQDSVNQELRKKGLINFLGTAEEVTLDTVSSALKKVLANPSNNATQARNMQAIVDGKGCQRVVETLLDQIDMSGLSLVPFAPENADIVLGWRNSERIRSNMLDDSIIEAKDHKNFLKALAADDSRAYFIVELRGAPVATLYFTGLGSKEVTWGCYIGSSKAIPGLFVALVVIAIKYSFNLPSMSVLRSEVAAHNANPIKLNRFLGIPESVRFNRSTASGGEVEFIEYRLTSEELNNVLAKAAKAMPSSIKESCEKLNLEK